MRFIFYSSSHYEDWDWTNSTDKGIGGSETSHVEMAWRLARRGHEVLCYAPVPWLGTRQWRDTTWTHYRDADFTQDGIWIIYRSPQALDSFGPLRPDQPRWLMCQDAHYADALTGDRAAKLDRIIALCPDHADHLQRIYPRIADKLWITSNGVKVDLIREVETRDIPRNPKRLIYASSPDRGLIPLLKIFNRARELEPDLELHVFYGFDNIDKLTEGQALWKEALLETKRNVLKMLNQDGVVWRGRVSQQELYAEWLSSGIWCYPTEFTETSCITCMEAQAMGAIPITNPLWALRQNVGYGIHIEGNPYSDELIQARYVGEIIRLVRHPELQYRIREPMMMWARSTWNWERWVDQWECDVAGFPTKTAQFCFQHKHARGRILNVGCDIDHTGWLERGAVNIDVRPVTPILKAPNRFHLLHDAREAFPAALGQFDTVILGDILEHLQASDWPLVLHHCREILASGGQMIITCPDDGDRERLEQHRGSYGDEEYAPGCSAFHTRSISEDDLQKALTDADLAVERLEIIDYSLFTGYGIIATPVSVPVRRIHDSVESTETSHR